MREGVPAAGRGKTNPAKSRGRAGPTAAKGKGGQRNGKGRLHPRPRWGYARPAAAGVDGALGGRDWPWREPRRRCRGARGRTHDRLRRRVRGHVLTGSAVCRGQESTTATAWGAAAPMCDVAQEVGARIPQRAAGDVTVSGANVSATMGCAAPLQLVGGDDRATDGAFESPPRAQGDGWRRGIGHGRVVCGVEGRQGMPLRGGRHSQGELVTP